MDRGSRYRFRFLALAMAVFSLASCLSLGKDKIVLPPGTWPAGASVKFLDGRGKESSGEFSPASVRSTIWGVPAILKGVSVDGAGLLSAKSIVFSFPRDGGGKRAIGRSNIACSGDGSIVIEWADGSGWTYELSGIGDPAKNAFSGYARSEAPERAPGSSALTRVKADGLSIGKDGRADWSAAALGDVSVSLVLGFGADLLAAAAGVTDRGADGYPAVRADLLLYGASGPLGVDFKGSILRGDGGVEFPEASEGEARLNLTDGFSIALSGLSLKDGSWMAKGSLVFPDTLATGLSLLIGSRGAIIKSFKSLELEIPALEGEAVVACGDWKVALSGLSFSHARDSALQAGACRVMVGDADGGLPSLPMKFDGEKFLPSSADASGRKEDVPSYGGRSAFSRVEWNGKDFLLGGTYYPSGILEGAAVPFESLALDATGSLRGRPDLSGKEFPALGGTAKLFGPAIHPGGSMTAAAIEGTLPGVPVRDYRLAELRLGIPGFPDGTGSGWIGNIAGTRGFTVDSSRPNGEGLALSGRARIYFSSGTHYVDQTFPTNAFMLGKDGRLSLEPVLLEGRTFNAFLGLAFPRVSAFLSGDDFSFTLGGGTFASGGFWPSGGIVEGLGLNLRTQKYILKDTELRKPALFSFKGAKMSLEKLDGAIDDAYLFSGTANLPAREGSPWEGKSVFPLKLLRLDEYGNPREIAVWIGGEGVDILPWLMKAR